MRVVVLFCQCIPTAQRRTSSSAVQTQTSQSARVLAMKVNIKWGKELYKDVEVDMEQPPEMFKMQLYSLTGVPTERQKVMGKGGLLKDDAWGKVTFKEGSTVIMMGSAESAPAAPKEEVQFLEDLPEDVRCPAARPATHPFHHSVA